VQSLLEDLNLLPGVLGTMFCDADGKVLARAFPPDYQDAALAGVASALAMSAAELKGLTGKVGVIDLRFRESRVIIRPAAGVALVALCDKTANAQEVLAFASVACKKLERARQGFTGQFAAPALPAPGGGSPVAGNQAMVVHEAVVVPPRRRTGLFVLVVLAALAAGAGGAYLAYMLLGPGRLPGRVEAGGLAGLTLPARHAAPAGPVQVKLKLSGADALAAELVPQLAAAYLSAQKAADVEITRPDSGPTVVRGTLDGEVVGVEITPGGTAKGLQDLLGGAADVAVATRRVKVDERERLAVLGTMTSPANEHVVGLDGIAVIVNKANSVAMLNREQLALILGGASSDWSQFGVASDEEWSAVGVTGRGGPVATGVHVYLPDDRSGLPEVVQALVLEGKPFGSEAKRLATYQAVADAVIADPGGIGVVPLPAVSGARPVPLADLDDAPLMPTAFTVASEDYLLTHRLYLYTAQASANPAVARFVDFALSSEGQEVVKKAGFVELAVKAEQRAAPAGAPPAYVRLTTGARRLSSTFRFEPGSSSFDSRAQNDLDRVVGFLRDNDLNGAGIRVLGYADAIGGKAVNQQLSVDRATQVAHAFAQRGIVGVTIAGMGSALPVADNGSEEGRRRNRRVEVWIAR
jgi:phosphate transport system substrate-binding protein